MSEPKPFASLSSGLLARKGAAKPAMRPQGFGSIGSGMEDLGWNDMGHGYSAPAPAFPSYEEPLPEHVPSSIAALTPAPKPQSSSDSDTDPEDTAPEDTAPEPVVVEQQRSIAERLSEESAKPAPKAEKPSDHVAAPVVRLPASKRQVLEKKGKAAFTLRLDPERHLKLRLACAVSNRSAQMLLTEALDKLLESIPEVDAMAGRLPASAGKRS